GRVIYSRGFASIFGEWETIPEARDGWGSFHESQRFPEPRRPVRLVLKKRGADGTFQLLHSRMVDPESRFVNRAKITFKGRNWALMDNGPPEVKADLLIMGDGYTKREFRKFRSDARRLVDVLFNTEPFLARRDDFNVRAIHVPAPESGISNPRSYVWRDNPLGSSYNSFDLDRYVLTYANRAVREIAAQVPYDAILILVNERKYGGGGILNLYTTAAAGSRQAPYLIVHEFGHSFAGLGDEYYTSPVAYDDFLPIGVEPLEPNITALLDPKSLKWWHLLESDTPIPTPWDQTAFDTVSYAFQQKRAQLRAKGVSEEVMDGYFREVKEATQPILQAQTHYGKVGAFEGAGYQARGLYRPEVDCIMFSRNRPDFCRVCSEAIETVIDLYAK
ncbi:MAG: M64 family metallopeptidase, partial [Candidatus Neomarinimicrobiota bacterium]